MFESVKTRWREARGDRLRKEVQDCVARLSAAEPETNVRCATTIADGLKNIEKEFGPLANFSPDGKRQLAKQLNAMARKAFDTDMGRGHGLFLLSAYIESEVLPGSDAATVRHIVEMIVDGAREANADFERAESVERNNPSSDLPIVLPLKGGREFFEMQCKFGHTELSEGKGVVALVIDAKKEFGTEVAVKLEANGQQLAVIRVASDDGGFIVPAKTPPGRGEPLEPNDVVIWVPSIYSAEVAKGLGDKRGGWVGFIRAKVAPELNTTNNSFRVLCEYG